MIEEISSLLGGVPDAVVYGLLVLVVVQVGVQVWALIDLARAERVVGGRKWLWAVVIVFLSNLALGAILYFAIGKRVQAPAEEPSGPLANGTDRTARAVESLYGPPGEGDRR